MTEPLSKHPQKFPVGTRVILPALPEEEIPEERGVVLEWEEGYDGMYIVEVDRAMGPATIASERFTRTRCSSTPGA